MNHAVFAKLPPADFPALELEIIGLWRRLDAFHASNRRRREAGGPEFVFYDGPPFATGAPHYGHLLAGTIKDIVPRYWSMRGHHVERRFGWDCHGLPIEALAQKELGLHGAGAIRQAGVDRFNETCRSMVQTYVADWRRTVERMGRWVDFDRDYKTMDRDFMESVWWVFKQLWDKGRIYRSHRIMPYSPKLSTPLSKFEVKDDNYKDVQDPAITVKFRLLKDGEQAESIPSIIPGGEVQETKAGTPGQMHTTYHIQLGGRPTFLLAWTTTPWTLTSNLALCVGSDLVYVVVHDTTKNENYILAEERLESHFKDPNSYRIVGKAKGTDLARASAPSSSPLIGGLRYSPVFTYAPLQAQSYIIIDDDYVTAADGTGIVHIAPAFGEDDFRVAHPYGLEIFDPIDEECRFTNLVPEYSGQFCKDTDKAIIKRLKDDNKLFGSPSTYVHSYPFCDRTDAPLIYRAIDAWYVKVEDLRDRLAANNQQIRWVPEAIGANRFGNWLKNANDWNISRNRFWGSCLPVWVNVADPRDCLCFGAVAELEDAAGLPRGAVADLHKHHLDRIEIRRDGKVYRRTPEVLDCWFESGAMPYGQKHYPFENKAAFDAAFPAQFIAEGLDQTRGWFYTLLVLSTSLFDKPAFRNVVVNGMILAEDGQKMSKSKKNYPDPNTVLDSYGADALRAYLIDSPVVRAEPMRFSEAGLKEIVRTVVLPYWNALSFFTTYANADGWDPRRAEARPPSERHPLDRWVLSVLQSLIREVNAEMEAYRLYNVVPRLVGFIDQLTNWYIRCSRRRFWESGPAQADAFATLYEVLCTYAKVLAPCMPFLTEQVHQRLVVAVDPAAPASVHWCDYPQPRPELIDAGLEAGMAVARTVVGLGRKLREDHKLKVRQPLPTLTVVSRDPALRAAVEAQAALIAEELNVKRVAVSADEAAVVEVAVKPNFKELGKRCGPKLKPIGAALAAWGHAEVARLESGAAIEVAGEAIRLGDVLLQRSPRGGAVVASEGAATVVLDTALTPALLREGLAREFVSLLQQARKDAGLEVSDRIAVAWASGDAEVQAALTEHAPAIAGEILATAFAPGAGTVEADLNGRKVGYALARA